MLILTGMRGWACRVQAKLGNVLATVIPRVRCVPAINPDDMSPDPAVVRAYSLIYMISRCVEA